MRVTPDQIKQVCSKISQSREKTVEAFLAISAARMNADELYTATTSLPKEVIPALYEQLKAIAASKES